jgi:hypothetical protein
MRSRRRSLEPEPKLFWTFLAGAGAVIILGHLLAAPGSFEINFFPPFFDFMSYQNGGQREFSGFSSH